MQTMSDLGKPPDPGISRTPTCARCLDPLAVTLHEPPYRRINHEVFIFRCPECAVLILDDIVGFKGHGTVFRASEGEISAYIKAPPGRPWPIALPPANQEA